MSKGENRSSSIKIVSAVFIYMRHNIDRIPIGNDVGAMTMRKSLRALLFISALAPVLFSLAYIDFDKHGFNTNAALMLAIGSLGCLIPLAILALLARRSEVIRLDAKKVEPNDFMVYAFIAAYLSPLVGRLIDLSLPAISLLIIVGLLCLRFVTYIPAHPLLNVMGYRFYKVEAESGMVNTLIARREILDPKALRPVLKISNSMLLES